MASQWERIPALVADILSMLPAVDTTATQSIVPPKWDWRSRLIPSWLAQHLDGVRAAVVVVIATSLVVALHSWAEAGAQRLIELAALVTLGAVARIWASGESSEIRSAGDSADSDPEEVSALPAFQAYLLLAAPLPYSTLCAASSLVVARLLGSGRTRAGDGLPRALGIEALLITGAGAALQLGWLMVDGERSRIGWAILVIAGMLGASAWLRASITGRSQRLPARYVWQRSVAPGLPVEALFGLVGMLVWHIERTGQAPPLAVLLVLCLIIVYRALRAAGRLEHQTFEALRRLADLIDERDHYTHDHSLRVARYAERTAVALGLPARECRIVFLAGRLHDIGKCGVSNDVLLKPGPLTSGERAEMERHASIGAAMLTGFHQFRTGARYVRSHHEWYDGSGYPDGLVRGEIPIGARIIAVADAYDAMTTHRPYRRALPHAEAVRRLWSGAGTQWDPRVVERFLELLGEATPAFEPRSGSSLALGLGPTLDLKP
jgi:putative nucleotidyltransferase with HDIG domain